MVFRKQKSLVVDPTVFTCVSMIAKAVGPSIAKEVRELIDQMLACGLRYEVVLGHNALVSNRIFKQS